uniref:IPO4/5-like TPR repeats domain-containing protein n=1 Tax=Meloidogyne enterolobii TaxID=390850 RepID=A0A6V7U3M5_MELEN|nr:unnamed protein product [Meloidogyne enterolobii]
MAAGTVDFAQLLVGMMSSENEIREVAEKEYEKITLKDKGPLLFGHYSNVNYDIESRSMALVLLRRLVASSYEEFFRDSQIQKDHFHSEFIRYLSAEQQPVLKKRLTDILAELARNTIDENTGKQCWTGVMQFLELCATSEDPSFRETGMSLIENVPNIFGSDSIKYINDIKKMFHASLLFGANSSVRTAAVRAYVAFVCDNDEDTNVVKALSDLIPAVVKVCQHVVETEDDDDVPLQCLSDLAASLPKILIPHFASIFALCSSIVANQEKDESYRHSSLEVMVSMCESGNFMKKKGANYLPALIQQCLHLMTELDDDLNEWMAIDDANEDLDEETAGIGETSLDRISCSLGGKAVMTHALQCINELLGNENWKYRHAGLCALSTIGEGCKKQMEPLIHDITNQMLIPKMNDPHPRVRYAACNAIGQMCTDFEPTIQKKCHETIVPALLTAMSDLNTPRVAAHAAAAMVNFCEECPKAIINIYLQSLMVKIQTVLQQTLQQMLTTGKKLVLEQIITTIASIADAAQDHFAAFYNELMPPLKYIFENSKGDNCKMLRGRTIECISLIGLAVGKDLFGADADQIMQFLLTSGVNFEANDDPQISYFISAWARICKVLGPGFAKYLDLIMPSVLLAADFKPEVTIVDGEGDEEDNEEWNYLPIGANRSLGIRTAGLEDKVTACEMIVCFARELKEGFAPYAERVMGMMIQLLRFVFHEGVRQAAAECLPFLLISSRIFGEEYLRHSWETVFNAYKDANKKENENEVICEILNGIAECVEHFGETSIITAQDIEQIYELVLFRLEYLTKRRIEREADRKDDEDIDDEDEQESLNEVFEAESNMLARLADINHYLFMTKKEANVPFFDKMAIHFASLLDPRRPYQDRQWAICIFDDLIEFGGPSSLQYQHLFLQPLVNALSEKHSEVRQAAAYGCGIMALKGGQAYEKHCTQLIQPLIVSIERSDARSTEESSAATENSISAIAKILKYNSAGLNVHEFVPRFVSWLPVWNDHEEVPYVYDYFCDLVESQHPALQGDPSRIFQIILHTFSHGAFDGESSELLENTKARMKSIMKHIQMNEQLFNQILTSLHLNSHQNAVLQQILT